MRNQVLSMTADRMLADAKGEYVHPRQVKPAPMAHAEWCRRYGILKAAAQRVQMVKRENALLLLKSVGMSDGTRLDMCCIHNCAISTIGHGWGWHQDGDSAARLRRRACQRAKELLGDYSADAIVRVWDARVRGY